MPDNLTRTTDSRGTTRGLAAQAIRLWMTSARQASDVLWGPHMLPPRRWTAWPSRLPWLASSAESQRLRQRARWLCLRRVRSVSQQLADARSQDVAEPGFVELARLPPRHVDGALSREVEGCGRGVILPD